ncbi:hypothetical protein KA005_66370, partial [bacterium]|nr:hypothetical protein [bacterium]
FPQMYEHIKKVELFIGQKIETIIPSRHPFYLMTGHPSNNRTYGKRNGMGWPTHLRRWCTTEKRNALNKWRRETANNGTFFIGIASDENRPLDDKNKYPLVGGNITEEKALQMCYDNGFDFGGLYTHFKRVSCWCCPLGGKRRAKILYEYFPELWGKIKFIQIALFHDFGGHENFLENKSYVELEKEFDEYGQIDMFKEPVKHFDFKEYIENKY